MIPLAAAPTVPLLDAPHRPTTSRGRVGSVLAVLLGVATVVGSYVLAVLDPAGRALDDAALETATGVGLRGEGLRVLELVGVPTVALAVLVLGGVALARGRGDRAVAVVALVLGAQVVTQLLKAGLVRPDSAEDNSLPSGHVTLVASLGVALVLVVPRALRPLAALAAAAVTGIAGVATMVAGWHRPSDVVAALGVVAATTGVVTLAGALLPGRRRPRSR
ncbi:phosphatase PAP2 family protein [Actinomycetospora straminea]|uniref:Phosphatidic acid phosphatase type 2/haloperoxidase domain-containing protein n=1 Tax=Actinomycetospora straminea TaxID=663607 RepID=A0ABP9E722_9PSEU|nr:phosphatase PAP2 family protein [Actinomycetospora straminea]MDD7936008.1 phosphatase PAP2 family protein [Actinomycetospora straminea]